MEITTNDRHVLRELAKQVQEIASDPVNDQRKILWTNLNSLKKTRPLVFIFEIPWNEMNYEDELVLQTKDEFCQELELSLRRTLYQWNHMQGDMVVENYLDCPPIIHDTGIGISEDVDMVKTDETSNIGSRHFHIQIKEEEDIEKIKMPIITYDKEKTEERYQCMCDIFDSIMPVRKIGIRGTSIAPWDLLVRLTGIEEILMDLYTRPEYVHKLIGHLTDTYIHRLDQIEALNLLSLNNDNTYHGGGYNYSDELPKEGFNPDKVRTCDMWGRAMAQIFSSVSPAMHEEFALQYENRYLSRFGLNYYGCCEPLHKKIDILRKIPNLRKISMSPWIDVDEAVENMGNDFVFSYKPNPAVLTGDNWDADTARKELINVMQKGKNCTIEFIMKDISTVNHEPQRLWEWAKIAHEVANTNA